MDRSESGPQEGSRHVEPPNDEAASAELRHGDCVGRFTVRGLIGAGGMSRVFEAVDPVLGRTVAIKLIKSRGEPRSTARTRLLREAQALARLHHPNVVTIYDVDFRGEQVFIAMEHIQGATLAEWCSALRRGWREILATFLSAGRGLAAAHAEGIVHRDIKPANIIVGEDRVVVVDFGLARGGADEFAVELEMQRKILDFSVTQTGDYVGTPSYMAPEQRARGAITVKSDQYSFCVALWEALHGERPPSTRKRPDVPGWVNAAIERGLERDPERRWPSMNALLSALARDPARRRRRALSAGLLSAIILPLALLAFGRSRREMCTEPTTTIWDDSARAAVRSAFLGTGAVEATERFDRVDRAIRTRVDSWARLHVDACAATEIRHEQPATLMEAQMACLARAHDQLAAFVQALGSIDAGRLDQAVSKAETIGELEPCANARALAQVTPPSRDPLIATAIEALEREVAHVEAIAQAGNQADAYAAMPGLVARARALGHQPLLARVLYDSGDLACLNADPRTASVDLYAAANAAAAAHDDYVSTEIYTRLVSCVGGLDANFASAAILAQVAEAALLRAASPPELRLRLYRAEWSLRLRADDDINALAYADLVLFFSRRLYGEESTEYARALRGLGLTLYSFSAFQAADAAYRQGLTLHERLLGPSHPESIATRFALGSTEYALGDVETAMETLERASWLTRGKEMDRNTDQILKRLGVVYNQIGRFDDAQEVTRRALASARRVRRPDHPDVTYDLAVLCRIALDRNDLDEATARCDEALALRLGNPSPRLADLADSQLLEAELALKRRDFAKAQSYIDQALTAYRRFGPRNPLVAAAELVQGKILLETGAAAEARPILEEALAIEESVRHPDAPDVVRAETLLSEALIATGHLDAAAAIVGRAVVVADGTRLRPDVDSAARFALARSLAADQRSRALHLAREARAALEGYPASDAAKRIDRWLASR